MDKDVLMGFLNLHDAFLNASLMRRSMETSPVETDPNHFHISDRARFERNWVMFLYVLYESWKSEPMKPVREMVSDAVDTGELNTIIQEGESHCFLSGMFETRSYMAHRDRREYWNEGRTNVIGNLQFNLKLHDAFSKTLLATFKQLKAALNVPPNSIR